MSSNPIPMRRPITRTAWSQSASLNLGLVLAVVLGHVMLLPPQFNLAIGGIVLPPFRIFLLASSLFIVRSFFRSELKMLVPDYLVLLAVIWTAISFYINSDFENFITGSVAQAADIGLSYFFARAAFRSLRDVRMFLLMMAPIFAAVGVILALESVTKTHLLQPLARSLLSSTAGYYLVDMRQGLMRAAGPFPHPILAGIVMTSLLGLYWFSGLRRLPFWMGVGAAVGGFFTVSSAGLLSLTMGAGLIGYNWLSERIANLTWRIFFVVSGIVFFVAELGTQSGTFNLLVRFASFNTVSSYYRTLIWTYGTMNVQKRPWFGLAYGDWDRPTWMMSSVDNFWLLQAMQFGLVPPLAYATVVVLSVIALSRRSTHVNLVDQRSLRGIAIAVSVMSLAVISVSIWLSAQVWFYLLIGMSVSQGYAISARTKGPMRGNPRHTRFASPEITRPLGPTARLQNPASHSQPRS